MIDSHCQLLVREPVFLLYLKPLWLAWCGINIFHVFHFHAGHFHHIFNIAQNRRYGKLENFPAFSCGNAGQAFGCFPYGLGQKVLPIDQQFVITFCRYFNGFQSVAFSYNNCTGSVLRRARECSCKSSRDDGSSALPR